jgi:hypothetical protein
MAGQRLLITALVVAGFTVGAPVFAEPPPKSDTPPEGNPGKRRGEMSPEFENVHKAIDALTPEQRKRFQENFVRWSNMSPEAKKALRDRDEFRRKRMAEDVEAAIRGLGFELDKDRSEQFTKRYVEERRKLEEQMRREMDEKRQPLVKEMLARLKQEFSAQPGATPAAPPAPASTPAAK